MKQAGHSTEGTLHTLRHVDFELTEWPYRRYLAQIRLDALSCLRALATASPRALHKHWSLFLADSPYLRDRHTLFSIIESDPSHSNRLQACSALEALLAHSAAYLNIAEDRCVMIVNLPDRD